MTIKAQTSPAFEALLGDLSTLAKATDVNQERIAAGRAAEGKMQHGTEMAKGEGEKGAAKKKEEEEEEERKRKEANAGGEKGEKHMAKSFTIKTDGGEEIQVQDASDLLKSLGVRLDETNTTMQTTFETVVGVMKAQGEMVKSLTDKLLERDKTISEQGELLKSLQAEVAKIGSAPAGRKAVVTVAERAAAPSTEILAKSGMPDGVSTEDFFAKALDLQREGKLTGVDIALSEACLNSGRPVPENIVRRVIGSGKAN